MNYHNIELHRIKKVRLRLDVGVFKAGESYELKHQKGGYYYIEKGDLKMQATTIKRNLYERKLGVVC